MSGNVWEWTRSLWGQHAVTPDFGYPYKPSVQREDLAASDDVRRVLRGGSLGGAERHVRAAARSRDGPGGRLLDVGFRVVVSPFSS